jgi:hypothetical protein
MIAGAVSAALRATRLFVGFSDDRGLVILRFVVAVFLVVLVIIIVGIPRWHQVARVDQPSESALGDVCDYIGSCRTSA